MAYLMKIQELLNFACYMPKGDIEKISLPELKRFFNFLRENVKIDTNVIRNFYLLSEKTRERLLTGGELSKEVEDFN